LEINNSSIFKSNQIDELNLQIGGNEIIRFSCACHKLNVSIRHAINLHDDFQLLLATLNKSSSHIRNTIKLNKVKPDFKKYFFKRKFLYLNRCLKTNAVVFVLRI